MRHRDNRRHNSYLPNLRKILSERDIYTQIPNAQAVGIMWLLKSATGFEKTSRIVRSSPKRFYKTWTFKVEED